MMARATALAIAALICTARAQTFTTCDPTKEDDCGPNPAIGRKITCDFTQGECDLIKPLEGSKIEYDDTNGAQFTIRNESNAPTIVTSAYMLFGLLEVELKAAPGQGIITALVLQSDCLDEISTELVGSKTNEIQTNYFSKGSWATKNRDGLHDISDITGAFHNYTIHWTPRSISWSVDGQEIRVEGRNPHDKGDTYPQTPSQVKLGTWVGGREDAPTETVVWAGGMADFSKAPFTASIRRIAITDFAGGDELPLKRTKEYEYTNKNGTYQSIKVVETDEDNETEDNDKDGPTPTSRLSSEETGFNNQDGSGTENGGSAKEGSGSKSSMPGTIAGIAVGSVVGVALIIVAAIISWRRWRRKQKSQKSPEEESASPSPSSAASELHGIPWETWKEGSAPVEVSAKREPQEMIAVEKPQELGVSNETAPVELDGNPVRRWSWDAESKHSKI